MRYATLMAHLELGGSNAGLLSVVGDLAERFDAAVVGVVGCQPVQMLYGDGFLAGDVIQQDRDEIAAQIKAAELEFQSALHGRANGLEWRSLITFNPLCDYLSREARCADLVITGPGHAGALFDTARHVSLSDLVMQAGRPVLIAPTGVEGLTLKRAVIGWKDTRETRRAILDAVPLLRAASQVSVVEIAPEADLPAARGRLADVAHWLKRHGIEAEPLVVASRGEDAVRLSSLADEWGADLLVAGAYGHSRTREWVLGGVTQDLLLRTKRCALVSH